MSTAHENRDFVVGGLKAGLAGDLPAFLAVLDPEIEIFEPDYLPYGGLHRGHDEVRKMLAHAGKVVDFRTLEFVSIIAEDDRLAMMMTVNLRANGQQRHIIEHWRMQSGVVRQVRVFWDALP